MITVSNIYSAKDFLSFIGQEDFTEELLKNALEKYKYSPMENVLNISFNCNWCTVNKFGDLTPTPRGKEISEVEYKEALFFQIEDIIRSFEPNWAPVIFKGREAAKSYLPEDIFQCFKDAGLFDKDLDSELVEKWDQLARTHISLKNDELLEVGRMGEKLSMDYEKDRTGRKPKWQSVEANFAGYDLLSINSKNDTKPLKIEIKATKVNVKNAEFYLSRNEWTTAEIGTNYIFHLWDLQNKDLFIIGNDKIKPHIPSDNGIGHWSKVKVKFAEVIQDVEPVDFQ